MKNNVEALIRDKQLGRAYRSFDEMTHVAPLSHLYDEKRPLVFCFDFNVEPGAAVVCQEVSLPNGEFGTAVIGEVYIPCDSDTLAVCRQLAHGWEGHEAPVLIYGDATGGFRGKGRVRRSDWDLVREYLGSEFAQQVVFKSESSSERARVDAINARLKAKSGKIRLLIDPVKAPQLILDLKSVHLVEGGPGGLDKKRDPARTYWSNALGHYLASRFPAVDEGE